MGPILTPPNLRRASLLCLGLAGGLILSPGAHDSTAAMVMAAALCFVFVGLVSRYGLPS